jgi:hypothetical protein
VDDDFPTVASADIHVGFKQLFGAIFFTQLQEAGVNIKVFQWMYYMSSFFNQFGPNWFVAPLPVHFSSYRFTDLIVKLL